jgi:hypothetical protein
MMRNQLVSLAKSIAIQRKRRDPICVMSVLCMAASMDV